MPRVYSRGVGGAEPLLRAALVAIGLGLLNPAAAWAACPSPSWAEYHGERATRFAWRALTEGRLDDAREQAIQATSLRPEEVSPWEVAARAAIGLDDWTGAERAVQALRRLAPDDIEGLELLGRVSVELGRVDAAQSAFRAMAGLQPNAIAPQLGLALVAARLDEDSAAAIELLAAACSMDPTLDLSGLLLRPDWAPLRANADFVDALNALLAERAERP